MYVYHDADGEHLHTLDDKPLLGTSTVCKIIAKPLTWWAAGCAVSLFGWTKKKRDDGAWVPKAERVAAVVDRFEEIKKLTKEAFLDLLDEAYSAHDKVKKNKAKEGTKRHASLEDYVKLCMAEGPLHGKPKSLTDFMPGTYAPEVEDFINWAVLNVARFLWCEVNCYSRDMWVGGIADIGYEDMQGKIVAGDHKSSKDAYFDQFLQIAGYDIQLSENGGFDANGNQTFKLPKPVDYYVVFPFGSVPFTPRFVYDVEGYRDGFRSAVKLYKLQQSY